MVQPPGWGTDHPTFFGTQWQNQIVDVLNKYLNMAANRCGTLPHTLVELHHLASLRLRWTSNHETHCEWVAADLLRGWHLSTTPGTRCDIPLSAESKAEIVKCIQHMDSLIEKADQDIRNQTESLREPWRQPKVCRRRAKINTKHFSHTLIQVKQWQMKTWCADLKKGQAGEDLQFQGMADTT